jgi:CRP/FNR family transcriptional regulator, cyclic AMP receptor protein
MQTISPPNTLGSLVANHPFLARLNSHYYHFFAECAELKRYQPGQEIFHEGNEADHFYLIQSGKVALETFVPGCGRVTIQTLDAGEALGWSWLFSPHEWHFTATAAEPATLIAFDAAALRDKAEENRDFGNELVTRVAKTLVDRLHATRLQLIDLYGIRP